MNDYLEKLNLIFREITKNCRYTYIEGTLYYVAKDIAENLGYKNERNAIADHCQNQIKDKIMTNGGMQTMLLIDQGDVYRLITKSEKEFKFEGGNNNMDNKIQIFENEIFGQIRTLVINEKPYFVGADIANLLGYTNSRKAIKDHCKYVTKRYMLTSTGNKEMSLIPEGDVYRLIIRSKLPKAQEFETWVMDEVIPTIRKHGTYVTDKALDDFLHDPENMIKALQELRKEREERKKLQENVEEMTPKVNYLEKILECPNAISVSEIAQDYGMSPNQFNKILANLGIQHKVNDNWILTHKYKDLGYVTSKTIFKNGKTALHTYWTQLGRKFLYDKLKKQELLPTCEQFE